MNSRLIDLGGGTLPHPRAEVIVDLHHPLNALPQDASEIPWSDNSRGKGVRTPDGAFDEVYSSHFLEHIHRGQPLINVMNEAWRVLKPGGTFLSILPLVGFTNPHTGAPESNHIGWQPWSDPTHVNYWWMPEAFLYFCEGAFRPHADYGMSCWAALGGFIEEADASDRISRHRSGPLPSESWWSIRSGWEGVVCLVKP